MLRFLIIFSLFSTSPIFTQSKIEIDSSDYDLVCLHPSERYITAFGNVKGILPHGKWILFTSTRKIASIGSYKKGQRHGVWTYFDINGDLMEKGKYKHGVKVGMWKVYEDKYVIFEDGIAVDQNVFK